jgi:hypothetical protein
MAKPAWHGKGSSTVCFTGRANKGIVYYDGEKNNSYELSGHFSLMRKYFYYSGGLFGYWGKYQVDTMPGNGVSLIPYRVSGFGQRHDIGGRIPFDDHFDMLLGISLSFFSESGKFAALTKDEASEVVTKIALFPFVGPDIIDSDYSNKTGGMGTGLNMDIRYSLAENRQFGLRYSLDSSKGEGLLTNPVQVHQITLHGTVNHITAYGQIGFGSYSESNFTVQEPLMSLGVAYSIPLGKRDATQSSKR